MQLSKKHLPLFAIVVLMIACTVLMIVLTAKVAHPSSPSKETETATKETKLETTAQMQNSALLKESSDAGIEYQDSIIFVGDSTTAHLRSRGVLTGGKDTKQVWCPSNNTLLLTSEITKLKIVYPDDGTERTIPEAVELKKPQIMVFTIGLNGIESSVKNKNTFIYCYDKLIRAVKEASPETTIIIQSIFPVASNCDAFSATPKEVNEHIDIVNGWLLEYANENGLHYLDTQSILKDENNLLISSYQNGDGIHLTEDGYKKILDYIRTHAVQK